MPLDADTTALKILGDGIDDECKIRQLPSPLSKLSSDRYKLDGLLLFLQILVRKYTLR